MVRRPGQTLPPRRRHRGRTGRIGLVLVSLALVAAGSISGNLAASAEDPTPSSAIAPYDPAKFLNGEASASGETFKFNIKQGNADIGLSYGFVLSNYRDKTGKSDARALDLGVFETLFGVEQCDGSPPILNPQTFPPKTLADSNEAGSDVAKPADAFMPGYGQGRAGPRVGTQSATATKQPSSLASTVSQTADMFFLSVVKGRSEATTSVKDHVRQANAVVTAKELKVLGGLFTFENPRWEAIAKSGKSTHVSGSFTFSRATVLGIPRSPEQALADLDGFKRGLEDLLKPLGGKLELPKVVVEDNRVRVTPMSFKLVDPPFGKDLIMPFLRDIQPLREAFNKQQLSKDCKNETNLLIMDILLGVLSGSGSVEIHAGGVEAWTDDTDFSVPPIDPIPPIEALAPVPEVQAVAATPPEDFTYDLDGEYIPGLDGFDSDYASDDYALDAADDIIPELETTSTDKAKPKPKPKSKDRRSAELAGKKNLADAKAGTAAVAVGLAGLLGALGLTFGEHLKARRTRRRIS